MNFETVSASPTGPSCLSTSAKRPHKNLARLLDAWSLLPPERRPVLVLPGYPTSYEAQLRARAARWGSTAIRRFLGWVPSRRSRRAAFASPPAFVFPALYEGFGLPLLEAMARGVPVACV